MFNILGDVGAVLKASILGPLGLRGAVINFPYTTPYLASDGTKYITGP